MGTFLFDEIVFGPIPSRRLGNSLGINLLSTQRKVCNFDCIYCECGFTETPGKTEDKFVNPEELYTTLNAKLQNGELKDLDAITYAGNGEPTLHPQFLEISTFIREFQQEHFPNSKIVLLTNGTTLKKQCIQEALRNIDTTAVKLDAGSSELIHQIDQPLSPFSVDELVVELKQLDRPVTIQTLFLRGNVNGVQVDNTSENQLRDWLETLVKIQPEEVMIYSLARDTPMESLEPIPNEELQQIAEKVNQLGIKTLVT